MANVDLDSNISPSGPSYFGVFKYSRSYYWNLIMRFSPIFFALSLFLATVSSVGYSQNQDDIISPKAESFMQLADEATRAGNYDEAIGYYETALALHPRNRRAYIGLAQIAEAQKLNGKAIRLYKEVLEINPNDQTALVQQGRIFAQKGAINRAEDNLARLKIVCGVDCAKNQDLSIAINDASKKGEMLVSEINVNPEAEAQN